MVIFAGSESSIDLNRSLSDKFLASLGANKIDRIEYDLPAPDKDEALIIDSGVQYNLISPATQTVTMYSNGALSTNSVTFYYSQQAATGAVTIRQIDTASRATITSRTETLSTGTHTVYAGSTPSGYTPVGSTSATVTVTSTGIEALTHSVPRSSRRRILIDAASTASSSSA